MKNELSNYKFTLNVPTETKIEDEMGDILQKQIKSPTLPPPYNPVPLLTTKKLKTERERINTEFLKTLLLLKKDQLE